MILIIFPYHWHSARVQQNKFIYFFGKYRRIITSDTATKWVTDQINFFGADLINYMVQCLSPCCKIIHHPIRNPIRLAMPYSLGWHIFNFSWKNRLIWFLWNWFLEKIFQLDIILLFRSNWAYVWLDCNNIFKGMKNSLSNYLASWPSSLVLSSDFLEVDFVKEVYKAQNYPAIHEDTKTHFLKHGFQKTVHSFAPRAFWN